MDASISFEASVAGQGTALVNELISSDDLRSGQLVELLDTNVELETYYLLHAPTRSADLVLQVFEEGIATSLARSNPFSSALSRPS